jgi:hypothetical protein
MEPTIVITPDQKQVLVEAYNVASALRSTAMDDADFRYLDDVCLALARLSRVCTLGE